jgi:NADH:ubiquinone reductase (H+-translocating)
VKSRKLRASPLVRAGLIIGGALAGYLWSRRSGKAGAAARFRELSEGRADGARVAIVGGGFAGLAAASALGRAGLRGEKVVPILVDRNNFNVWTPLLYQVVTGSVDPGHVNYPLRFAARDNGFVFRESELRGVDLDRKMLTLDDGDLSYDYLILALGSVPNYFGMSNVARETLPLKWSGNAIDIHNRIIETFEQADLVDDPVLRRELLTIGIVGGGATGVELAGSLHDLIHGTLLRQYPRIRADEVRIILIEAKTRLLPETVERMSVIAERHFASLRSPSVEVWLNTCVGGASTGTLLFADGRTLKAGTLIWSAGIRAHPLADHLPVPRASDGRPLVNRYLELPEHPDVFVVGDLACYIDRATRRPLPANAQFAIQGGNRAAANVLRQLRGQSLEPFDYRRLGDAVSLGAGAGVTEVGGVVFDGFPALVIRRGIYLLNLIGLKNRLDVLIDWVAEAAQRQNIARFGGTGAVEGVVAAEPALISGELSCPLTTPTWPEPPTEEEPRAA